MLQAGFGGHSWALGTNTQNPIYKKVAEVAKAIIMHFFGLAWAPEALKYCVEMRSFFGLNNPEGRADLAAAES